MQVRKWLISGEINYNVCRICSLTLLPPEVLIPTPITLSVEKEFATILALSTNVTTYSLCYSLANKEASLKHVYNYSKQIIETK